MISTTAAHLPKHRADRRDAGYSLIELAVVLVLLGLVVMVGMPAMQDWLERYRVRTSAQSIAADLQLHGHLGCVRVEAGSSGTSTMVTSAMLSAGITSISK